MLYDLSDPEQTININPTDKPGVIELHISGLKSATVDLRAVDLINEVRAATLDLSTHTVRRTA